MHVLREVLGVQLSMGAWYGSWWVWLERCRDSSYAVNVLVVCACSTVCTVACFIGFWESVFWWKCIPTCLVFALFGKCFFCNLQNVVVKCGLVIKGRQLPWNPFS